MFPEKLSMWWLFNRGARCPQFYSVKLPLRDRRIELLHVPRTFLLTVILLLTACGFHPMYGDNSETMTTPLAGNLTIDPIGAREGQILRIALEDKLNPEGKKATTPEFRLHIQLTKSLIPAVVKNDGTIQRYDMQLNSSFSLIRIADNKILLAGDIRRTGSYNVAINANFATYEAEQDVITRTLQEMAEDYTLRMATYFAGKK